MSNDIDLTTLLAANPGVSLEVRFHPTRERTHKANEPELPAHFSACLYHHARPVKVDADTTLPVQRTLITMRQADTAEAAISGALAAARGSAMVRLP